MLEHRAHNCGNEHLFRSWLNPDPSARLPSSWSYAAPRAIQCPTPRSCNGSLLFLACHFPSPTSVPGAVANDPLATSLYWFSTASLLGRTPPPCFTGIHECIFDLSHPDPPPFSQHGRLVWSLAYGYPSQHLSLWLASNRHVGHRQVALRLVIQRALALVGVPPRHRYTDITVALLKVDLHKKLAWTSSLS